jgi:hypothetical protein
MLVLLVAKLSIVSMLAEDTGARLQSPRAENLNPRV